MSGMLYHTFLVVMLGSVVLAKSVQEEVQLNDSNLRSSTEMTSMILMQKTKCASRAQMLGFAPYLRTWEGRKSQNRSGALLSAHLACELRTSLAKCASRVQPKCALNLEEP